MNISTKTVTTRTHTGSFSADEIKAVALSYATKQAGVTDAGSIMSSKVDVAGDGSVTVEIIEAVAEASPKSGAAEASTAPVVASGLTSIVTAGISTPAPASPAPGFATGFSAAPTVSA